LTIGHRLLKTCGYSRIQYHSLLAGEKHSAAIYAEYKDVTFFNQKDRYSEKNNVDDEQVANFAELTDNSFSFGVVVPDMHLSETD
jgi:hypothetical protein